MERAIEIIRDIQLALWVLLGVAATRRWLRRRQAPEAYIAGTFGLLALIAVSGRLLPDEPQGPLEQSALRLLIVGLTFIPYLLFRFAGTFRQTPRAWQWYAIIATAAAATTGLLINLDELGDSERTASVLTFLYVLLVQWASLSFYTAFTLWRGGRGQPNVTKARMRTLAMGAIGLSIVLIVSGTNPDPEQTSAVTLGTQIATLVSAPLFLLGFAPPALVVYLWRRKDERALRRAQHGLMRSASPREVADALLPPAVRMIGGSAGELRDSTGAVISTYRSDQAPRGTGTTPEVVTVPMEHGELVVRTSSYAPYFGAEAIDAVQGLTSLTDLALARAQVLAEQHRLAEELRVANTAITEFVAIASHDLRTPLAVVSGLASLLDSNWEDFGDAERREQIEAINRRSQHLTRIVEDLLTVSRLGTGAIQPMPEVVDLAALVESVTNDLTAALPNLRNEVPPGTTVWADPTHVMRMMTNYLNNAAAYGEPPVTVSAARRGDHVVLRVADEGAGVPAESRGRLFEKFWRADKSKSQWAQGTGLGLAIVRGLAQAGGGDAWYEHEDGHHSFAVSLPVHG